MSKSERQILSKLRQKQLEISDIAPQDMGSFTDIYKNFIGCLKVDPWKIAAVAAILLVLILRFFLGASFVNLATILQAGF